jgi:hypothetical protein
VLRYLGKSVISAEFDSWQKEFEELTLSSASSSLMIIVVDISSQTKTNSDDNCLGMKCKWATVQVYNFNYLSGFSQSESV